MKTYIAAALLALLPAVSEAKKPPPPPAAQDLEAGSVAVTPEIIAAITEEMHRATDELELPGQPKPYEISYKITEVEVNHAAASLGYTTSKKNQHFVNLEARVRVGNDKIDNSNFVVAQAEEIDGVAGANLPLEATPRIARRAAWLVTDAAYKEALIELRAKLESRHSGGTHGTDAPPWLDTPKLVSTEPVRVQKLETVDDLEARAKTISAVFRDQAVMRDSRVALTSYLERRWYLTTEGTNVTDTRRASGVAIVGSGQADDGQELHQYFLRYGHTAKDLPDDAGLKAEAKKIVDDIAAMKAAPPLEKHYYGPVLFEGEGAVGLIRNTLAPQLDGTPVPEGLNPQDAKEFGGELTDKVGVSVLSPQLTIVDDPTAQTGAGKALIGGYKLDDEGVAAQRVEVVKNGMLKSLLTTRTPSAKGQVSNGHARKGSPAPGGAFHGSSTNLFVSAKGGTSRKALEQRLVQAAVASGLKYGLVIRKFDDAALTAAPEFTRRELVSMVKSTDQQLPPPAVLAYKVYPNGKMEMVRGLQLATVPVRAWEDVLGTSTDVTVYNYLAAQENQLQLKIVPTDDGFVPSGGVESAIITPDLLIKKLDVGPSSPGSHPAPAATRPTGK